MTKRAPHAAPARRLRYSVAMSLDGYIAGPQGEANWIVMDPDIDFGELFRDFDALLMGRTTYEAARGQGGGGGMPGMRAHVVSRTLRQEECPGVTVWQSPAAALEAIRAEPGKDVWLFGGGALFRSCLELGLVDTVEVGIIPVLLGGGVPLLPAPAPRAALCLTGHRLYPKTGTLLLEYAVAHTSRER